MVVVFLFGGGLHNQFCKVIHKLVFLGLCFFEKTNFFEGKKSLTMCFPDSQKLSEEKLSNDEFFFVFGKNKKKNEKTS